MDISIIVNILSKSLDQITDYDKEVLRITYISYLTGRLDLLHPENEIDVNATTATLMEISGQFANSILDLNVDVAVKKALSEMLTQWTDEYINAVIEKSEEEKDLTILTT